MKIDGRKPHHVNPYSDIIENNLDDAKNIPAEGKPEGGNSNNGAN